MKSSPWIALRLLPLFVVLAACREKGPAEKVGESLDRAIEDVQDAVDPKGPVEKAGEKIDEALGK